MRQIFNRTRVLAVLILVSGCASTAEIDALNAKISILESQITNASRDSAAAKVTATQASSQASAAENSANRAAEYAQDTNKKLDKLIKK